MVTVYINLMQQKHEDSTTSHIVWAVCICAAVLTAGEKRSLIMKDSCARSRDSNDKWPVNSIKLHHITRTFRTFSLMLRTSVSCEGFLQNRTRFILKFILFFSLLSYIE